MGKAAIFMRLSRESGSRGPGVLLDAASCAICILAHNVRMQYCFLYKRNTGSRWGWTRYVGKRAAREMLRLNSAGSIEQFTDKALFDERFGKFLHREWLCLEGSSPEELGAFLRRHPDAIAKPRRGKGGFSVEQLAPPESEEDLRALFTRLLSEDKLVEEHIRQHPAVSEFYAKAVNTIRITSLYTEDGPVLLAPLMRIGCGGSVADNFDSGGVLTMLDLETGRMLSGAMNKQYAWFDTHPESGKRFEGFQVPHWDEALAICREAALMAPETPYIGWDVAITPERAILVEGNTRPSFGWQCVDRRGWRREFMAAFHSARRRKEKMHL